MKVSSREASPPPGGGPPPGGCGCDHLGPPPPQFRLPPPPPPPPMRCPQPPAVGDGDFCDAPPVVWDLELVDGRSPLLVPSTAAIALACALFVAAASAAASVLLWKYRRKAAAAAVRYGESPRASRSDISSVNGSSSGNGNGSGPLFEDSLRPHSLVLRTGNTVQTPRGTKHRRGCPAVIGRPVFVCADPYSTVHDLYQEIGSTSSLSEHIYAVPHLPASSTRSTAASSSPLADELSLGELPDTARNFGGNTADVSLLDALMERYSGPRHGDSHGPGCVPATHKSTSVVWESPVTDKTPAVDWQTTSSRQLSATTPVFAAGGTEGRV